MNNLTLKQLRYFEALARHGHFGRAADACSISQPALSMQIKELELSLDTVLFERGSRRITLTAFGEEFGKRVHDILRSVDELGDLARASQLGLMGRLRIGVIPTIAPYLLPTLLGNLSQLHDGLDIQVRETLTQKLIQELTEGRLDTAIVALPISEVSFTGLPCFLKNSCWFDPDRKKEIPFQMQKHWAKCHYCCWRKVIVSVIRHYHFATFNRPALKNDWRGVPFQPWFKWSMPVSESPCSQKWRLAWKPVQ
jgi:LysR family hydrogen peroxide-inducible transcriptional activator